MRSVGLRTIKTAISVFICMNIFKVMKRPEPLYACIAAVICMKPSVHTSFVVGKNRMIGTFIGGIVGIVAASFFLGSPLATAVGIVLVIYLCNCMGQNESIVIACVVFIIIMTNVEEVKTHIYAIGRMIDTFIGIIVSITVNKFVKIKYFEKGEMPGRSER